MIRHLPRESSTAVAQHGPDVYWGLTEQLLAAAVDALNAANWQRSGGKRSSRPKPIPRPGVKSGPKKLGKGTGMTLAQVVERQRKWAHGELHGKRTERHALTVTGSEA